VSVAEISKSKLIVGIKHYGSISKISTNIKINNKIPKNKTKFTQKVKIQEFQRQAYRDK